MQAFWGIGCLERKSSILSLSNRKAPWPPPPSVLPACLPGRLGSWLLPLSAPAPAPAVSGLNFHPKQSGFPSVSWGGCSRTPSPRPGRGGDSVCICTSVSPWSQHPRVGRNQKSPPSPHPQVCCKQPDPPPRGEPVLPDSWAFPHCREMEYQGKPQVWPSQAL